MTVTDGRAVDEVVCLESSVACNGSTLIIVVVIVIIRRPLLVLERSCFHDLAPENTILSAAVPDNPWTHIQLFEVLLAGA